MVAHGGFPIETGRLAARRLLGATPRPTAIFAANDETAIGASIELKAQGLRVPEDVLVVGFDGIEFAGAYDPPRSTVRQPRRDMGRAAMALLVDLLEGRRPAQRDVVLPHEPAARASRGSAPAQRLSGPGPSLWRGPARPSGAGARASRAGCHAWSHRPPSGQAVADAALPKRARTTHASPRQICGRRRRTPSCGQGERHGHGREAAPRPPTLSRAPTRSRPASRPTRPRWLRAAPPERG